MHFAVLPPEVNSARMYAGPGAEYELWQELISQPEARPERPGIVMSEVAFAGGFIYRPARQVPRARIGR